MVPGMRRFRNAKIIATLGPTSSSRDEIANLFEAGADVFRLNFSHGTQEGQKKRYELIRELEAEFQRPIGVLADLQGPKLRVGEFEGGGIMLHQGQPFRLDMNPEPGNPTRVSLPHPEVFSALEPGTKLLVDDGRIRLRVTDCGEGFAETEVIVGGRMSDHKGVNVPDVILDLSPLTEKDHDDLRFALQFGVDWVALSFVQRPADVAEVRKVVAGRAGVMAKMEKPQGMQHLDVIVDLADAIMVARGDLGVELPPEEVPGCQKNIIRACREAGKPVIVATQMLESMIDSPTPTRAEASDVATAIYDGADAVMLSAETAVGKYGPEAVSIMERIIRQVELDDHYRSLTEAGRHLPEATAADAITAAARQVAKTISAACIVTFTSTGSTTLRASRERPSVPILGLTARPDTARRSALVWGVHSVETMEARTVREMVSNAIRVAREEDFANIGDALVITAGVPFGTPGATNLLRIAWVE